MISEWVYPKQILCGAPSIFSDANYYLCVEIVTYLLHLLNLHTWGSEQVTILTCKMIENLYLKDEYKNIPNRNVAIRNCEKSTKEGVFHYLIDDYSGKFGRIIDVCKMSHKNCYKKDSTGCA